MDPSVWWIAMTNILGASDSDLVVIILVWNNWSNIEDCLQSLSVANQNYAFDILLIDNGSKINRFDALRNKYPNVKYLVLPENLGFAGGNNVGIKKAIEAGYDYVMLLNDDTVVHPLAVGEMMKGFASPKVGAVVPKIYFFEKKHKRDVLWGAGVSLNIGLALPRALGYRKVDDGAYDTPTNNVYASGCAIAAPSKIFAQIGLLDEDFFHFFEDVEWSWRVRQGGFSINYVPSAIVWHKEGHSLGGALSPAANYFNVRNRFILIKKMNSKVWPKQVLFHLFCCGKIIYNCLRIRSLKGVLAVFWGLIDAARGVTGYGSAGRFTKITDNKDFQ
jgi:GT2 family glycosyltransferase